MYQSDFVKYLDDKRFSLNIVLKEVFLFHTLMGIVLWFKKCFHLMFALNFDIFVS